MQQRRTPFLGEFSEAPNRDNRLKFSMTSNFIFPIMHPIWLPTANPALTHPKPSPGLIITGSIFMLIGLAVFAIRLTHDGPYAIPHGAAFYGALINILLGLALVLSPKLWPHAPRLTAWVAVLTGTFASLPAIYSIVGESEEVISLFATDSDNQPADLRLWIVDRDDGAWVGMGRDKATSHNLNGARLEMLRNGQTTCVTPSLYEDRPTVRTIHGMKVDKYLAAQAAAAIGLYPREAGPSTVALRLDPCESDSDIQ